MKKILSLVLVVILAFSALTGCKAKKDESFSAAAQELKLQCADLAPYIEEGHNNGYIDDDTYNEFYSLSKRLDEILEGDMNEDTDEELDDIRERLAVMASQAAAPNEVVDSLVQGMEDKDDIEDVLDEINESDKPSDNAPTASDNNQEKLPLSEDFEGLITDFTNLQNEAAQKIDKGEVSMEDYTALIEAGTDLAAVKEEIEQNGESDALKQKTSEIKAVFHDIAVKMNSPLADKFN